MSTLWNQRLGCASHSVSARAFLASPCPSTPCRASTPALASASPTSALTVDHEVKSADRGAEVLELFGSRDNGPGTGFFLRPPSVGDTAVAAMLREGQELAVQRLNSEMSQLLEELEAELSAYVAPTTTRQLPASTSAQQQQQPQMAHPGQLQSAGAVTGAAAAGSGAAALELSAAEPRQTASVGTAVASTSAPASPPTSLAVAPAARAAPPAAAQRPPLSDLPALLLPPPNAALATEVAAAGAGAGDRAQRRRRKWQRGGPGGVAADAPSDESRYKAYGKSSMAMFMGTFTADRILSAAEEQKLAAAAQDFLRLEDCRRMLAQLLRRPPSLDELAEMLNTEPGALHVRLDCGNRARAALAQKNYRLVVSLAKRLARQSGAASGDVSALEDAVTAGMEGLMKAIRGFDPNSGFKLSTYATWWIRQFIVRHLRLQATVVTLPSSKREAVDKMLRLRAALTAASPARRPPSREQLAAAADMSPAQVAELEAVWRSAIGGARSLEAPVAEGEPGRTVADVLSQEDDEEGLGEGVGTSLSVDSEEHYALGSDLAATVDSMLASLDERDRAALRLAYGLEVESGEAAGGGRRGGKGADGATGKEAAKSGAARLQIKPRTSAAVSVSSAMRKLRKLRDADPRVADWVEASPLRQSLPVRVPGYIKKTS